jgi:hypothetical protein
MADYFAVALAERQRLRIDVAYVLFGASSRGPANYEV